MSLGVRDLLCSGRRSITDVVWDVSQNTKRIADSLEKEDVQKKRIRSDESNKALFEQYFPGVYIIERLVSYTTPSCGEAAVLLNGQRVQESANVILTRLHKLGGIVQHHSCTKIDSACGCGCECGRFLHCWTIVLDYE